jgi:hypothetical protein
MHLKGSRFIGSSWVTQPFLLTRAILAKVELQQTVENIRHSVGFRELVMFSRVRLAKAAFASVRTALMAEG